MWWMVSVAVAVVFGYWLLICPHKYWIRKGVKQGNPGFIFGDNWGTVLRKQSLAELVEMIYNQHPNDRYSGFYLFLQPTLLVRDPDLIKQITVRDFDHFLDHRSLLPEESDPLWSKNLFALTGRNWLEMRRTLSPAFTSSKMKYMFSLISQNCEQFVDYFLRKDENLITIELEDIFTRFANDVIAKTVFGVECDSLRDRNNEFYWMARNATDFTGLWKILKFFGYLIVPTLYKLFKISIVSSEVSNFFNNIIKSNIQSREKHGIVRLDMIHFLVEAKNNGLKHDESETGFPAVEDTEINKNSKKSKIEITDEVITSQAMIFLFAGFDTVSTLLCFMSYELAVNPDIQHKLIQEVDETSKAYDGKLTYEAVPSMKYMDMVISESLRKWPNASAADRICTKPYTIEPRCPGEKPLHLEKNATIWIPIFGLHWDPQYYPEPDRFIPERFNDKNKANINPYTYLPFGTGPRSCIGARFALLEIKILFFHLLTHFSIVPVQKTQIPLVLSKKTLNMTAENGFWLGLQRRCRI